MNGRPMGVPDLRTAGQVIVIDWRLFPAPAVDIRLGGLTASDAPAHFRVIDVPRSKGYVGTLTRAQLEHLRGQIDDILAAPSHQSPTTASQGQEGTK